MIDQAGRVEVLVGSATDVSEVRRALGEREALLRAMSERMHELQSQREQEQLIEATPEILLTFKGFGENGYAEAIDELPKIAQHQLGVKVVESLNKARDQVLSRVLRTRRIAELASVAIIEDAAKQVSDWVKQFEHRYSDEINEVINAGRNVRTLEDVATL